MAFDVRDGHLECGAVWYVMDYDGARQVRDRSNWGNELAPCHYDWIREAELWMSCILERDDGALVVFGGDGGRAICRPATPSGTRGGGAGVIRSLMVVGGRSTALVQFAHGDDTVELDREELDRT